MVEEERVVHKLDRSPRIVDRDATNSRYSIGLA